MRYENRQPPEGINNVERGWARDFIPLVVGFFAGLGLLCWLLLQLVAWSARWMPFTWEQTLTQTWQADTDHEAQRAYLQQLTDSLARAGGLSPEIALTIHYTENNSANAFATLGGNIMIFSGLLDAVESEQGLAFVIAHEIAHIQHRHPVQAVARSLSLSVITTMIFGQSDLAHVAGFSGNLALLTYSRQQEAEADTWALHALHHHYGHVAGADELFHILQDKTETDRLPQWLSTHPDLAVRIEQLQQLARAGGYRLDGELIPGARFSTERE